MKRIIVVLIAVLAAVSASAQYADMENRTVDIKGSRVFVDGEKLSKEAATSLFADLNGVDRSGDYLKYRKGYKAGLGMVIGGASLVSAGALVMGGGAVSALILGIPVALTGEDMPKGVDIALGVGCGAMIAGAAVLVAGIPTLCVYKSRLNNLEASFGPQSSGLGLALRF